MPIYEYWCERCGKEFEQMRPMSQSGEPASCPTCGTSSLKVPSVFASKENYTIKVPRGGAFRQRGAGTATAAAASTEGKAATKTAPAKAAPVPKAATKPTTKSPAGAKPATAARSGAKATSGTRSR